MDTHFGVNKIQLDHPITRSVEKLVKNISMLNEEPKVASNSISEEYSQISSSLVDRNEENSINQNKKTSLAFIEAQDMNEMNEVIEMLKKQFPNVNLRLCKSKEENEMIQEDTMFTEIKQEPTTIKLEDFPNQKLLTVTRTKTPDSNNQTYRNQKNNLSTNTCYYNQMDRASSFDNSSSISSNNNSFERQESKDSGYCNRSKSSFGSIKSLSLGENSGHQKHLLQQQNLNQQLQSSQIKQAPIQFDFDLKMSLSPTNGSNSGRIDTESRRFLTSPTNFTKSSVYNWKKWKKGQTWRYNSSSNLSETNSMPATNENSNNSFNNGYSNNSSFSNEKAEEDYQISSSGLQQSSAICSHPSGLSFSESENTGFLQAWSSASNIGETDVIREALQSKKRRGKLVRDTTIDNGDEQTSLSESNPCFYNQSSSKESSHFPSSYTHHHLVPTGLLTSTATSGNDNNNNNVKHESTPLCLSRCSSPTVSFNTGRISPPEKRLILDGTNQDIQKIIHRCQEALYIEDTANQIDLSVLVASIVENKSLVNSDIIHNIIKDYIRQQINASSANETKSFSSNSKTTSLNRDSTASPVCLSSSSSSSSKQYCQITSNLLNTVQQLSHLSLKQEAIDSMKKNQLLEYYQDLQRLVVTSSSNDERNNSPKNNSTANGSCSSSQKNLSPALSEGDRLNPANNKYYILKSHQNSNSFECGYVSQRSPIYRSNSSPSYSSVNDLSSQAAKSNISEAVQSEKKNDTVTTSASSSITKPLPEIVITESRTDGYLNEYESIKQLKVEESDNGSHRSVYLNNNNLNRSSSSDLNKALLFSDIANFSNHSINFKDLLSASQRNQQNNLQSTLNENNPQQSFSQQKQHQNLFTSAAKASKLLKPHVCTSCHKKFARSDMLIRHSRLHSGIRPYRCNRCGQEFSRSDHLNTHLRTHTGEKPYSCPHPKCTYAACRKDMITRHLKVHNKNKVTMCLSFDASQLADSPLRSCDKIST